MRPLLLGEAPAPRRNREALDGPAGDRLARLAGMADRAELLASFDAANLVGRWPGHAGKGSAWCGRRARRAARRRPLRGVVVLLGGRVAAAYGLDGLGWGWWLRTRGGALVCAVPHPSGVNRLYNDSAMRDLARNVLAEALALAG